MEWRMLIVGYCYGVRFERRLCQEVELHLAYRWFCRLDLDDLMATYGTAATYAKEATATIPIVTVGVDTDLLGLMGLTNDEKRGNYAADFGRAF